MSQTVTEAGVQGAAMRKRFAVLVTLTYAPEAEWEAQHIRNCLKCLRQWADRREIRVPYTWVAELTKAGRVHYHIVLWLPNRFRVPKFDDQGWWPWGSTNVMRSRDSRGRYLRKYVSKMADEVLDNDKRGNPFPPGLRLYARGGFTGRALSEIRFWLLPAWLRKRLVQPERVRKVKGGFLVVDSGEVIYPPYRAKFEHGVVSVLYTGLCLPPGETEMEVKAIVREVREVKRGDEMRSVCVLETTSPLEMHEANLDDPQLVELAKKLAGNGSTVLVGVRLRGYRDRVFFNVDSFAQVKPPA